MMKDKDLFENDVFVIVKKKAVGMPTTKFREEMHKQSKVKVVIW